MMDEAVDKNAETSQPTLWNSHDSGTSPTVFNESMLNGAFATSDVAVSENFEYPRDRDRTGSHVLVLNNDASHTERAIYKPDAPTLSQCRVRKKITLQRARQLLSPEPNGTWILHNASDDNSDASIVLSVSQDDHGSCWQGSINEVVTESQKYFSFECDNGEVHAFNALEELVAHFTTHPIADGVSLYAQLQSTTPTESKNSLNLDLSHIKQHTDSDSQNDEQWDPSTKPFLKRSATMVSMASHRGLAAARLSVVQSRLKENRKLAEKGLEPMEDIGPHIPLSAPTNIIRGSKKTTPRLLRGSFLAAYFIVAYFGIGLLFYTQHMGWDFDFALYFIVIVVTTVGYGDHDAIKTDGQKLFTLCFVLVGVALVMTCITLIVAGVQRKRAKIRAALQQKAMERLMSAPDEAKEKKKKISLRRMSVFGSPKVVDTSERAEVPSLYHNIWVVSRDYPIVRSMIFVWIILGIGILFGTHSDEEWTFVEALYWAVITGTTVGFGDYHPSTSQGYWFAIFFIFILVVVVGNHLNNVSERIIYGTSKHARGESSRVPMGVEAQLRVAAVDGNVSKDEWLRAILVALGLVDETLVDVILNHFDIIDKNGDGLLTMEQLLRAIEQTPVPEYELDKLENSVGYISSIFEQLDGTARNRVESNVSNALQLGLQKCHLKF